MLRSSSPAAKQSSRAQRSSSPQQSAAANGAQASQRNNGSAHPNNTASTAQEDSLSSNAQSTEKRVSLLDIIRERLAKQGKTSLLYRVLLCGELTKDLQNKADLGTHYQNAFKLHQTESDLVTGILLIYGSSFLHYFEASQRTAFTTLLELYRPHASPKEAPSPDRDASMKGQDDSATTAPAAPLEPATSQLPQLPCVSSLVHNVRVVHIDEDCASRSFPFWAGRVVEAEAPGGNVVIPPDALAQVQADGGALAKTCAQMAVNTMELGKRLSAVQKTDLKTMLDTLNQKHAQLLPNNEILLALSRCEDAMSLDEWVVMFDIGGNGTREGILGGGGSLVLEEDLVWPAQRFDFF
ncbi:hypothetical protein M427DRAFT_450104 [Gonapodya prolifera JEL478]|uniref:Uncharacterized protein n=1 Tax=Gonapodya prolifera (strain JEL478) TaxID=1344416 RepID=A0A139ARM1_GONPJ|nr:hypothetical protein M427DRAFT_450104 [Gonapodya prolifera JEL478]|eukprot:KXS19410.1 hypothetical protein M427DRAFT_450104 [Gonapodya prolifera JEL478]